MKTKTKKIFLSLFILCILTCFTLTAVACGTKTQNASDETTTETTTDTTEATTETTETTDNDSETETTVNAYTVTFVTDENVTVTVYETQDINGKGTVTDTAYARNGDTGTLSTDGTGQVNFTLSFSDGYALGGITVSGTYKNVKAPEETAAGYRITKIESDLTVTVKAVQEETKYAVTFVVPEGVTITVYDTQDVSGSGTVTDTAYARSGDTGEILSDGTGQVNFIVSLSDGVELDDITVSGGYKNLKNDPEADGSANYYRITKITSDCTVTITTK